MGKRRRFSIVLLFSVFMICCGSGFSSEADPGQAISAEKPASATGAFLSGGVQPLAGVATEYLYGAGSWGVYLIQVDHPAGEVSSAKLFSTPLRFYGAAGSDNPDYFWATTPGGEKGIGSALYKVYPREKATVKVGDNYGQDPHYPADPNYVIGMKELAYDDDADVLYGTDYLGLYSIDTTTGQASFIGDFGNGPDGEPIDQVFSMAYDSANQQLVMVNQKWLPDWVRSETHLYTVDPATASPTFVAATGSLGMTDLYESQTSGYFLGVSNNPHEILEVNSTIGTASSVGWIGHNILGLGGDFPEQEGPFIGFFSGSDRQHTVTSYSELDADRVDASDLDRGGYDGLASSAAAFVQEAGQAGDIGQETTMALNSDVQTSGSPRMFLVGIDFDSGYNGPNDHGRGGGTATLTWQGHLVVSSGDGYENGDRVLALIDGSHLLDNQISAYVLDWELKIYDDDADHPVLMLTDEDVPDLTATPFLGALQMVVGTGFSYDIKFSLTLNTDMLAGDISADGKVNLTDFGALTEQWSQSPCNAGNLWCEGADVDRSGDVGLGDLTMLADDWVAGNVWDDDNHFSLDLGFAFKTLEIPESEVVLNHACEDAITVMENEEYYGSTASLTTPSTDITDCGTNDVYDVWFYFVPEQSGLFRIDTEYVSGSNFYQQVVSVFDGCGGNQLHCWDVYETDRYFEAESTPGKEYLIRVAGNGASKGDFKLMVKYYEPPANDDCSGAFAVEKEQYYSGTTQGATGSDISGCGDNDAYDVWYQYTTTDDSAAVFIAYSYEWEGPYCTVSVFDSCDASSRQELACGTYGGGEGEPMSVAVLESPEAGETYYVRVACNDFDYGRFDLEVTSGPDNDDCSDAQTVTVDDSVYSNTIGATGTDITSCGDQDLLDVWYEFTAGAEPISLIFEAFIYEGAGDYTVSVFDACEGPGRQELACGQSTEGGEGYVAKALYTLSPGETVYIRVAFCDNMYGEFQLNVTEFHVPDNDECADAEELNEWADGATIGTTGVDETTCVEGDIYDVWYTFTPSETADYSIEVESMEMPMAGSVAIFSGTCESLTEIDCAEVDYGGGLTVSLTASQTYLVRVASIAGGQEVFSLIVYSDGGGEGE